MPAACDVDSSGRSQLDSGRASQYQMGFIELGESFSTTANALDPIRLRSKRIRHLGLIGASVLRVMLLGELAKVLMDLLCPREAGHRLADFGNMGLCLGRALGAHQH